MILHEYTQTNDKIYSPTKCSEFLGEAAAEEAAVALAKLRFEED